MKYRKFGNTDIELSVIGLGGHEFYPNGKIKGFSDDPKRAVIAGEIFPGFGGDDRKTLVKRALDAGINFFDLTIDSEKEAMGRVLKELAPSQEIFLQTRPEGMVYSYDPANKKMASYELLRAEATRILGMLGRETIDIFNFAFMQNALDADSEYLEKIGDNIQRLKQEGLIRFASADTFSGENLYVRQYASEHFDSTFINYNIVDTFMNDKIIPIAKQYGMAVLARELFMKSRVFAIAEEAGFPDRNAVAAMAMRWVLSNANVTSAVLGVRSVEQLEENLKVLNSLELNEEEQHMLEAMESTTLYKATFSERLEGFRKTATS